MDYLCDSFLKMMNQMMYRLISVVLVVSLSLFQMMMLMMVNMKMRVVLMELNMLFHLMMLEVFVELLVDICKRHPAIGRLRWKGDKSLVGQPDKQNIAVHRWFAYKACPGDYIYERLGAIADEVNRRLDEEENKPKPWAAK